MTNISARTEFQAGISARLAPTALKLLESQCGMESQPVMESQPGLKSQPPRGVLPYIGYTGMCRWKGMVFKLFSLV